MNDRLRSLIRLVVIWLVSLLIWSGLTAWISDGIDSTVLIPAFVTGAMVVVLISAVCRRWGKPRASLVGLGIGLIPTLMGLLIGVLSPKTIDASAGWIALSLWLSVPNGLSGAIGGFAASRG